MADTNDQPGYVFRHLTDVVKWVEVDGPDRSELQSIKHAAICLIQKVTLNYQSNLRAHCECLGVSRNNKVLEAGKFKYRNKPNAELESALTAEILKLATKLRSDGARESSNVISEAEELVDHTKAVSFVDHLESDAEAKSIISPPTKKARGPHTSSLLSEYSCRVSSMASSSVSAHVTSEAEELVSHMNAAVLLQTSESNAEVSAIISKPAKKAKAQKQSNLIFNHIGEFSSKAVSVKFKPQLLLKILR